jgi:Putative zinc-finger
MTCEELRELLPEHLLGTVEGPEALEVRRHLRGCAGCREERTRLEEGVVALSRAAHDEEPPAELERRVLATLRDEWRDVVDVREPAGASTARGRGLRPGLLATAAVVAVLAIVGSIVFGEVQMHRAQLAEIDAASYRNLLHTLGGEDFRVGSLRPAGDRPTAGPIAGPIAGQVLLYDGDPAADWRSWGILLVHAPPEVSTATATLIDPGGRTQALPPLRFENGEAHSWIVSKDLSTYDRLTITAPDGTVLATARIDEA